MSRGTVLRAGKAFPGPKVQMLYEAQVASASEIVRGRGLSKGTADYELKLCATGATPIALGDIQTTYPGLDSNGSRNTDYATDGKPINALFYGPFIAEMCLDDGASITKGNRVKCEADTGKAQAWSASGPYIGIAMETRSASGADLEDFLIKFEPGTDLIV